MKIFSVLLLLLNLALWVGLRIEGVEEDARFTNPKSSEVFTQSGVRLMLLSEGKLPGLNTALIRDDAHSGSVPISMGNSLVTAINSAANPAAKGDEDERLQKTPWCGASTVPLLEEDATGFLEKLRKIGGEGNIENKEIPISYTWWVYLPPFAKEQDARTTLNELQAKRIDSFYVRSGELVGGISLGVFSTEASAQVAQAGMRKKGYAPEIRRIAKIQRRSKLTIKLVSDELQARREWQDLDREFPAVKLNEIECK